MRGSVIALATAAVVLAILGLGDALISADPDRQTGGDAELTEQLLEMLFQQGVSPECVLGADSEGIPILCETAGEGESASAQARQATTSGLPAGTRGWETIPGVIRDDGLESSRLEVDVNGPVSRVTIDNVSLFLIFSEPEPFELRDDGLNGDRVAGDFVFTSGPFRFDTSRTMPSFFLNDSSSPAGLSTLRLGFLSIEELDGTVTAFLIEPSVGILSSDIPETNAITLSPNVAVSPHLINVRSDGRQSQLFLRFRSESDLQALAQPIYEVLPDMFDFFMLFSMDHVERLPRTFGRNFVAGTHLQVKTDFTGTGLGPLDNTALFGSEGRLLGINVLDSYSRGISSRNATHELLHQWVNFISPTLGLSQTHYPVRSSVGSLVGGFLWTDNGDGTFTRQCDQGNGGAHQAPPLDKYMMGLVDSSEVGPIRVDLGSGSVCGGADIIDNFTTVTIADIQRGHGVRTPGPADAQRDFAIAFVAESHDRFLTPTEMTFYEILAEQYTKAVPPQDPDPYVGPNWVPITRFFGEGTAWRSDTSLPAVPVTIDVTPGSPKNIINVANRGVIPVAILGSTTFDVNTVNVTSVRFGPGQAPVASAGRQLMASLADVNGDRVLDLRLFFRTQETGISSGDTRGCLVGQTSGGQAFQGCDTLTTKPP